jgi:hypothetical protein
MHIIEIYGNIDFLECEFFYKFIKIFKECEFFYKFIKIFKECKFFYKF